MVENAECGGARFLMMSSMLSISANVLFLPARSRRV